LDRDKIASFKKQKIWTQLSQDFK